MEIKKMLYEGKAKQIFETDDNDLIVQKFKDDATAFNGEKKGQIVGKGVINNSFSSIMFDLLEKKGISTHFIKKLDETSMLVKKVDIIKLEVIVRNIAAGSFTKRYGVEEGTKFANPTFEFSYKNDDFGDPLMNDYHAVAMNLATWEEIEILKNGALKINELMKEILDKVGITLVDFKLEFGRTSDGKIVLADEISPDTCRFWDKESGEKLDKDRFRKSLGNVEEAYNEMLKRMLQFR